MHRPVLLEETINYLNIKKDGIYVDCTLGDGGHSSKILKKIGSGRLISLDFDIRSIQFVKRNNPLATIDNWTIIHDNFAKLDKILDKLKIKRVDGFLFDIGLSSRQLGDKTRGFSFHGDGELDMRMDDRMTIKAVDLLNCLSKKELEKLFAKYGEEKYAKEIASRIVRERKLDRIDNVYALVKIIFKSVPPNYDRGRKHPARRVFQALRIAVNDEINNLKTGLTKALDYLNVGGRIVVVTYHSLEQKIVEDFINKNFEKINLLTPIPVTPSETEIVINKRSRSAKMFVIEKSK